MDDFRSGVAQAIPALRRFARAMTHDPALADDLVQDCLVRALAREHLFEPGTNLQAWLFTILRNCTINHMRRRVNHSHEGEEALEFVPTRTADPICNLELRDLSAALQTLPPSQREVVLLIGLQDMSYEEAAQVTGATMGTVKSRLSRARATLRRLMEGKSAGELEAAEAAADKAAEKAAAAQPPAEPPTQPQGDKVAA